MYIKEYETFCMIMYGGYLMWVSVAVIIGLSLFRTMLYKMGGGRPYWNICDKCKRMVTVDEIEYCRQGLCNTCCSGLYKWDNRICTNGECSFRHSCYAHLNLIKE